MIAARAANQVRRDVRPELDMMGNLLVFRELRDTKAYLHILA
jgi:hypothetical protein